MASLQLQQQIEDEKAKRSRLEWCLREILAERDVLLRQHEDDARRKRQEELQHLNQHLSSPAHARPRSTSAPPIMTTNPLSSLVPPVGPPSAQPLRPKPHSFRLSPHPQQPQQLPDLAQLPFLSLSHSAPSATCEAARLLGLAPGAAAAAPTDTLIVDSRPHQPKYHQQQLHQPVKRARLNSLPATALMHHHNQPNLLPRTGPIAVHSLHVSSRQAPVTSVDANPFHALHHHNQPHHHSVHAPSPATSTTTPTTTTAGCESPVGGLPLSCTPPQCMEGLTGPPFLTSSCPSSSFEWADSSTNSHGAAAELDWPLSMTEEVDYDELLNNLSSGL